MRSAFVWPWSNVGACLLGRSFRSALTSRKNTSDGEGSVEEFCLLELELELELERGMW